MKTQRFGDAEDVTEILGFDHYGRPLEVAQEATSQ
jgi:hypothetical protein